MEAIRTHRNLLVWQEAMSLVAAVYLITQSFPRNEWHGLAAQARRSAISIPSNIAEGAARNSSRECLQFIGIATGSLSELETQIELGIMLKYLPDGSSTLRHVHRVGRLLTALRTSLRAKIQREQGR
jgi:four helix bundle protein